jgi:hypothetical protein
MLDDLLGRLETLLNCSVEQVSSTLFVLSDASPINEQNHDS